jgi:hypothetical protein
VAQDRQTAAKTSLLCHSTFAGLCRNLLERGRGKETMPSYDICYLNEDGSLNAKIAADCANDMQAKVLAHALQAKGSRRIEVWNGVTLIYERPLRLSADAAAA